MDTERLEWFAGLLDAEGCFHIRRHSTRPHNIVVTVTIGLVHLPAMSHTRTLVAEITGDVPNLSVRPAKSGKVSQREFYGITVSGKEKVFALLTAVCPFLRGKRVEALLSLDVIGRARRESHYRATDADFNVQRLSSEIKRGSGLAKAEAVALLGSGRVLPPPSAAWIAGMLDGDGSIVMVRGREEHHLQGSVVFGGADREAVDDIRRAIGAELCTAVSTRPQRGGARAFHAFALARSHMVAFLHRVRPFMIVKATEADLLLASREPDANREVIYELLRRIKTADYIAADEEARVFLGTR